MTEIVKTMKLHIHVQDSDIRSVEHLTEQYRLACNFVSQYIFDQLSHELCYSKQQAVSDDTF